MTTGPRARAVDRRRASLASTVYDKVFQAIVSGEIGPGEFLSEQTLTRRFDVSRTPIREALIHLYKDGLLQKGPFRSYAVGEVSLQTVRELFQVRLLMEPACARLAAENPLAGQALREAERAGAEMQEIARRSRGAPASDQKLAELDVQLHVAIAEASGNRVLAEFVTLLHRQVRRFSAAARRSRPYANDTLDEHRRLLDAIKAGDAEQAEQRMHRHIQEAMKRWRL
jgi:DNA-binding GntR family transcriptional regulator